MPVYPPSNSASYCNCGTGSAKFGMRIVEQFGVRNADCQALLGGVIGHEITSRKARFRCDAAPGVINVLHESG